MTTAPLLVVTNAEAGSAADSAVKAALAVLRAQTDVRAEECSDPAELDAILDRRDGRRIVVAGGDGSLHVMVAALHRRAELSAVGALGLIPLGTGNDLARALTVPLNPADAANVVLHGRGRDLDLLVDDNGGIVVNAVHVGIGAEAARTASDMKDRLGAAAYPVGSVLAGVSESGWALRVEVDGSVLHDGDTLMVGLANGTSIGGGTPLAPEAVPDDGLVDVIVATSTGPLARLGYAVQLRRGEQAERDDVLTARGVAVRVSGDEFRYNADGELFGPAVARTWVVQPRAWQIMAPP